MPRPRVQKGSIAKIGIWWKLRWYEHVAGPEGKPKAVKRSEIIGAAEGPERISKKEARRRADEDILRHVNSRAYVPASVMSLQQFVTQRFDPEIVAMMKHSGKEHYKWCFGKILPVLGTVPLKTLDVTTLQQYLSRSLADLSVQSVVHLKNALSATIEHAKRTGMYTGDNPARLVRLPEMDTKKKPALTFEQAQKILRELSEPYRTMALMSMTTSLNSAELCGLRWKRVNLGSSPVIVDDDRLMPLTFAVRENYYKGHWGTVKSKKRNRIQPIPEGLAKALRQLKEQSTHTGPDDPVFSSRTGTPIDAHNANRRILKRAGKAAGVPGLSWHSFRRTTATLTNEIGMPDVDRVATMGHADLTMTNYYSDSSIERRRGYIDQLSDRLTNFVETVEGTKTVQ